MNRPAVVLFALAPGLLALVALQGPGARQDPGAQQALAGAFRQAGLEFDRDAGLCGVPVTVEVRNELLEYLLVAPHGAAHETLFVAEADAEVINAALLALGVAPGTNARWVERDPLPSEEELRAGASPYEVLEPEGDGFYLYAAWREGDEPYFYRVEDLVRDLDRGRTMRRHRWVYLGSRMIQRRSGEESFAASLEGNLVNISFFAAGNTLVTAALEECVKQTVWLPNAWLLPGRGSTMLLLFSKDRLDRLPACMAGAVPTVAAGRVGGGRER